MAFPGLYNEVAHVSTEPTTVSTAAVHIHVLHTPTDVSIAACTYLPYLLLYLLYLLLYLEYVHVLYLLLCSTYLVLLHVQTALLMYVRLHTEKKGTAAEQIGTYRACIL